ncbi:ImmA/IrrE family metallo-endopeptidase [Caproiciproducens sp. NJN-50]|uniref:ImmA/IrrE family metallo-endopeptidase n=1 Tax=Acutalibacteraceae TaxID=3082771 RepID=UPI000FFE21B1|nr:MULTISPECIES: ImmA/IrrE family metallo-endopeptidase [Acutalibacteraceae]QAT48459.1 ImmA/IrrE family metallo-endopeptidase [Caproiciproducens sp. NJN-50]
MNGIEKLAHRITKRFGSSSPFCLCDCMGVQVRRLDLPERVRGFCFRTEAGQPIIVLQETLSKTESGYCCAHELGHLLLHPGLNAQVVSDLTNLCAPRYEREADLFAACLLIDPNFEEWSQTYNPLTQEQIARLSGLPRRVVGLRFEK